MIRMVLLFISLFLLFSCNQEELIIPSNQVPGDEVSNFLGVSYVATNSPIDASNVTPVRAVNANFIAVIPFALGKWESTSLKFNNSNQWWGETEEGVLKTIQLSREQGLNIMIKPQIWFWGGHYTGHFGLKSESDWVAFENNYREYILMFARIAEKTNTELFCIGTELESFVKERPVFWQKLIQEIRAVYSGKLTYAGNWDSYKNLTFWLDLDYIGVDAYFPLTQEKDVTENSIRNGWIPWLEEMKNISNRFKKEIILTEVGYRSIDYSGKEPWASSKSTELNMENQRMLYKVLFEEVWSKEYIKGGFLWKWFPEHASAGGIKNDGFTPQNKPVEQLIKDNFWNIEKAN